jgi:hypothetical protein
MEGITNRKNELRKKYRIKKTNRRHEDKSVHVTGRRKTLILLTLGVFLTVLLLSGMKTENILSLQLSQQQGGMFVTVYAIEGGSDDNGGDNTGDAESDDESNGDDSARNENVLQGNAEDSNGMDKDDNSEGSSQQSKGGQSVDGVTGPDTYIEEVQEGLEPIGGDDRFAYLSPVYTNTPTEGVGGGVGEVQEGEGHIGGDDRFGLSHAIPVPQPPVPINSSPHCIGCSGMDDFGDNTAVAWTANNNDLQQEEFIQDQ